MFENEIKKLTKMKKDLINQYKEIDFIIYDIEELHGGNADKYREKQKRQELVIQKLNEILNIITVNKDKQWY